MLRKNGNIKCMIVIYGVLWEYIKRNT